jgi:tRNA-Thr(GGU) m(6)t(6)A37 methyltransferase TsaA
VAQTCLRGVLGITSRVDRIELAPTGNMHTPYGEPRDMPIQGRFNEEVEGWIELNEELVPGLQDLDGFSHLILIYYFHRFDKEELEGKPYLEHQTHGIFAIRSPYRPNRLGLSIVKLSRIEGSRVCFTEVDMLEGTPLLDIKPYVEDVDRRENVKSGWLGRHRADGGTPDRAILG